MSGNKTFKIQPVKARLKIMQPMKGKTKCYPASKGKDHKLI